MNRVFQGRRRREGKGVEWSRRGREWIRVEGGGEWSGVEWKDLDERTTKWNNL